MSRSRSGRSERGSVVAEAVILTPVVALFILTAVGFGRVELSNQQVDGAARAAAEAAAVAPNPTAAQEASTAAVSPALAGAGRSCQGLRVVTDTSQFEPGGMVRVTVICVVSLSDVLLPGIPGALTVQATATAPIDPYRVVQ